MLLKEKFYEFKCEELIDENVHPDCTGILINYDLLSDYDKELILVNMDFAIDKNAIRTNPDSNDEEDIGKPCWKLIDKQGANLANIESDEFSVGDYDSLMDRLDNYYHDYGYYFVQELDNLNLKYTIVDRLETI